MRLHELKNTVPRQARKRVGRGDGSGNGRTAGRGEKGYGSRTGSHGKSHFEGGQISYFRRLPKRGFTNPNHIVYNVVNVGELQENFAEGEEVNVAALARKGFLRSSSSGLKILGDGEVSKQLKVTANKFSASARRKIEAAGGVCSEA